MTEIDPFDDAINQLTEALAAVQAERDRLRETSAAAEQNRGALAESIAAAAESLRATLPQVEQPEQEPA